MDALRWQLPQVKLGTIKGSVAAESLTRLLTIPTIKSCLLTTLVSFLFLYILQ